MLTGPIQIKRPDVAEDIRALAMLTGTSITDSIATAVRNQLAVERVKAEGRLARRREESARTLAEIAKLAVVGPVLTDDDLYDADGLPR